MKPPSNLLSRIRRHPAVIVFLISALPKLIFGLIFFADTQLVISDPDSIGYFRLAENLRHHGVFSRSEQPPFIPDNVLTPIYPLFLAALFALSRGKLWIIPLAQGVVNSLTAVVLFKLGERLFGRRAGFIAGLCWGLDLSALVHTFSMLTETLFTFLFLAANFFLIHYLQESTKRSLAWSAALLGLAVLCRPVAAYFFVLIATVLFLTGKKALKIRAQQAVIYVAIYALIITPWVLRNKHLFGVANLSAIQGVNLLLINAAYLKAAEEKIDYRTAERLLEAEADSLLAAQEFSIEKIKLEYHGKQYGYQVNDPQQAQFYQKLALQKILASPLLYAKVHLIGIIPSLIDTSVRDFYFFRGEERPMLGLRALLVTHGPVVALRRFWSQVGASYLILYLLNLGWLVVHYIFALLALYRLAKEKSYSSLWLMLLPFLYLLFITAPAGSERFRFPGMPYLYALSGWSIAQINWLKLRRER